MLSSRESRQEQNRQRRLERQRLRDEKRHCAQVKRELAAEGHPPPPMYFVEIPSSYNRLLEFCQVVEMEDETLPGAWQFETVTDLS